CSVSTSPLTQYLPTLLPTVNAVAGFCCYINLPRLILRMYVSTGCTLLNNLKVTQIRARARETVLLPCHCTDLNTKESFSWRKHNRHRNTWEEISSDQYGGRVQLVNEPFSGNLSLQISNLTEEDGGDYRCYFTDSKHTDIQLTVEGCSLLNNLKVTQITARARETVLLPCYCTDLNTKESFSWRKHNRHRNTWEEISSDQYGGRVQLVNEHFSGNLSLQISNLTEEDGGDYRCYFTDSKHTDIQLTVEGKTT
ncbi:hypothetical protein NFI96_016766, partial [Prochilodus magdalenae]